jgi:hypothetical protein
MTEPYVATVGADLIHADTCLRALLDWLGAVHESGESIAVWRGAVLVLVIDGAGHTIYIQKPEAHRV